MKNLKKALVFALTLVLLLSSTVNTSVFAATNTSSNTKTTSSVPKTAAEVVADMGIGWNLGNSLDAMNKGKGYTFNTETIWGNPVTTKEMIDTVAKAGYGAIRVPVSWYNHIDSNGKIDQKWLQRVGEVVKYGLDNDLYVIINIHHDAGMDWSYHWIYADTDSKAKDQKNFINLWTQIATYFKDYDEKLLFEATNEIMNSNHNWDWGVAWKDFRVVHDLDQEFINTVRSTGSKNKNRFLVLSTWAASSDSCQIEQLFYKNFTDTASDKLIMSVHNYTTNTSYIPNLMKSLSNYSKKYNIPVIIDEFGSTSGVALDTRITAAKTYVSEAKKVGITCFWWDNNGDFQLLNRKTNTWRFPTLVEAMVNASKTEEKPAPAPVTYKKLNEVNFSDVASWRSGHYDWTTGKYESYNGRICLTNYVLPESGKIYVVNVPSNYNMLIRELDKDGKFLRSSNLANQATFTPVANCYKLGISIYNPSNSNVSFNTYKNLIKNGTSFSLTLLPPDTSKKISEVNFSEKANWRTGNFDSTTGLYAKFKGRMCLTSYVLPDTGKAYTVNVPSEFCMLIGELDKNGNLLKTTELKNQETFTPVANCYKLGISVYYPDNCHFSFDAYLNLMKKGTIFSLTEKTAAEYTNMDYYQCLGYNKTGYFKDTTVPLNEKCSIEMKVSTTPYQYANLMNTTNTRFRIEYNIGLYMAYSWWNEKNYTPKENEVFVVKEAAGKAYINGKQVRDCTSCKIKFNSTGMEFGKAVCNIYYLKVWDENNKLIRSYIPVKNKDGKPCFYDEVTKKYFYASK